ncbi:Uncharacterized protein FWK35_00022354, partial [Aphis craccivora]
LVFSELHCILLHLYDCTSVARYNINIKDIEAFEFIDDNHTLNDCNILNVVNQNEIVNLNYLENGSQHIVQTIEDCNIIDSRNEVDDCNVIDVDNQCEVDNLNECEYDLQNIGRKRNISPNTKSWSRNEFLNERKEKTSTNNILHDTLRGERKIGPTCTSKICEKWKTRNCSTIKDDDRLNIFNSFWKKMPSWKEKQIFVLSLVDKIIPKQRTSLSVTSRRNGTFIYYLKVGNNKLCVCRGMFLSTLGLKESTLRYWLETKTPFGNNLSESFTKEKECDPEEENNIECQLEGEQLFRDGHKTGNSIRAKVHKTEYLNNFFDKFPNLPSHYCRQSSRKLYLQTDIISITQLYNIYNVACKENNEKPLSRRSFDKSFYSKNLSIFSPKKDQCDTCCQFKVNNLSQADYQKHIRAKDKMNSEAGECHVFTCDLKAVQLLPYSQASSIYYKMKLAVHNYTIYNLGTHEAICYWFDETQCELVASTFATCLIDTIEKTIKNSFKPVKVYSDECTAQNRNSILSNALLHLSVKYQLSITQKFLEKGHTQMECDSVHSVIERKLKKTDCYLPCQLSQITLQSRQHPFPYKSEVLTYSFFLDYSDKKFMFYESIRPGRVASDAVITDLRVLKYCPNDDFKELPRRLKNINEDIINKFPKLYQTQKKITLDKWNDLQSLKSIIPYDCHSFYDGLPHMETIITSAVTRNYKLYYPVQIILITYVKIFWFITSEVKRPISDSSVSNKAVTNTFLMKITLIKHLVQIIKHVFFVSPEKLQKLRYALLQFKRRICYPQTKKMIQKLIYT